MSRLLVFALLWSPLAASACCHPSVVTRPVVVRPPSCLVRPAPLAPDVEPCSAPWAAYYLDLSAWVVEVESACGERSAPPPAKPDPGPAWWTRQPVVTHGD